MKIFSKFSILTISLLIIFGCESKNGKSEMEKYVDSDNIVKKKAPEGMIYFSDILWRVESGAKKSGEITYNVNSENVKVDSDGFLHLTLSREGEMWYGAEIVSDSSFGFGEYVFFLSTNFNDFEKSTILNMSASNTNLYGLSEIGIDIAKKSGDNPICYYIIDQGDRKEHNLNEAFELKGEYSTHKFYLNAEKFGFASYEDHGNPTNTVIEEAAVMKEYDEDDAEELKISDQLKYSTTYEENKIKFTFRLNAPQPIPQGDEVTIKLSKFKFIPAE